MAAITTSCVRLYLGDGCLSALSALTLLVKQDVIVSRLEPHLQKGNTTTETHATSTLQQLCRSSCNVQQKHIAVIHVPAQ